MVEEVMATEEFLEPFFYLSGEGSFLLDEEDAAISLSADPRDDAACFPNNVVKKRRNRQRAPHHALRKKYLVNLFPRIIKRDIRRFYPRMIANIYNSFDSQMLLSFLRTYSLPTVSSIDSMPTAALVAMPTLPESIAMKGFEDGILSFLMAIELVPDATLEVRRSDIRQFRNVVGRSELDIEFVASGTKLFDLVLNEGSNDKYHMHHVVRQVEQEFKDQSDMEVAHSAPVLHQIHAYLDATRFFPRTASEAEHINPSIVTSLSSSTSTSSMVSTGTESMAAGTNTVVPTPYSMPCKYMPGLRKIASPAPFAFSVRCLFRISLDEQHRIVHIDTSYPGADTSRC